MSFQTASKWARESDQNDLTQAFPVGPALKWPDIISRYRTILLSEAGSGKTEEMRHQARMLVASGKPAFFLRLENVVQDFQLAFEIGTPETFSEWLDSVDEGWIFLDSVDEARLRSPSDFQLAIRRVGRQLLKARDRTHIIISGRSSAWRARSDYTLCVDNVPIGNRARSVSSDVESSTPDSIRVDETAEEDEFKIITLDALNHSQIEQFAREFGISHTKKLLTSIERADAFSSTSRPQDLVEIIAFWKANGRVGSRYELMRYSIEARLSERDPNRGEAKPLDMLSARKATKLIAAATTLSKNQTILVPDHEPGLPGLALNSVLPQWTAGDQAILLSRPIFDDAIYGAVRFYHRTVREYLTAEWLHDLLQKQTSRRRVYELLFKEQYGVEVVPPVMKPIAAWLIILDEGIRTRVLKIAPEIAFEGGDPAKLPSEVRAKLLREICERVAQGKAGRTIYDYGSVQRFAGNDIADTISVLISKYNKHEDILWFLLRLIWIGEIKPCLAQAKKIALNRGSSVPNRVAAFKAVSAIGSDADKFDLRLKLSREKHKIDRGLIGQLVADAPFTADSIKWLKVCIGKATDKHRYSVDQLEREIREWISAAPISFIPDVISALTPMLSAKPVVARRYCEISKQFGWLLHPLCVAVQRLIGEKDASALTTTSLDVLQKFPAAKAYDVHVSHRDLPDFANTVGSWPELNRSLGPVVT